MRVVTPMPTEVADTVFIFLCQLGAIFPGWKPPDQEPSPVVDGGTSLWAAGEMAR